MEAPLPHYFIRTARFDHFHDKFDVNGNSLNYFLYLMKNGCRSMEIDVHNSQGDRPSLVTPDKGFDELYLDQF